ncbi:MAG: NADH-quinone oxidoreductase subunit NuoF [Myxococcales bacterium]|nr:NADH-quinone oxidoreductase subunit NuoF [Myxococcales bacterium]USN50866.1 MAG: NADH-quinone oxidoreductase subunit NuoF [Myxococcales bacterium]
MKNPLTGLMNTNGQPLSLKDYQSAHGYEGLNNAIKMEPGEVISLIKEAGLLGRGGAGFSTGIKMSAVPPVIDEHDVHYLVVNADEMEPGTFKDRWLLEGNPHQLIEGVMIAAHAIGAKVAYIFLRGEYKTAEKYLEHALHEAHKANLFYNLDIFIHMSAGRYICGEETALLNALEGRRATPRAKPPFPQVSGLWGKPTLVQNVETVSNLPHILRKGAAWFKTLGKAIDAGTKIYGVSGKVNYPGAFELPMGTLGREILENCAGGMRAGLKLRAFLPGGASTDFLTEEYLDVPMDYSSMAQKRTRMGTGTMIILDDHTCPVGMLLNLEKFFKQESCGFCTPCREGLSFVYETLSAIERGEGQESDIGILENHARLLGPGSTFCALAPGASAPLGSGLKLFRKDFLEHIAQKRCPYGN